MHNACAMMRHKLVLLSALLLLLEAKQATAACESLQSILGLGASPPVSTTCYALAPTGHRPTALELTSSITGPLTWDHQFSVGLLTVREWGEGLAFHSGANVTLANVTMLNVLLATSTKEAPIVPALLNVGDADISIVSSTMTVMCSTLRLLRTSLPDFSLPGIRVDASSVHVRSFHNNRSRLHLQDVTITCNASYVPDTIFAQASTGSHVQRAIDVVSKTWAPLHIDLLSHITLDGLPKQTWPKEGYRVPRSVSFHGVQDNQLTVLDLAGMSAFLRLEPGQLLHFYGIQVQGLCMTKVPLLPGFSFSAVNDMWSVYTGDGITSQSSEFAPPRIVKLIEVHDSIVLATPAELYASLYWYHLVPPAFPEIGKYSEEVLKDLLVTPDLIISNVTNSSITYINSQQPSMGLYNSTASILLPLDVPQLGFNKTAVYSCNAPSRPPINIDDPSLDVNRTLSPIWVANRSRTFLEGLTGAAFFITKLLDMDIPVYAPPLVLVISPVILQTNISNRLVSLHRDTMIYGPSINTTAAVPGNPTTASVDLQNTYWLIRLNDGGQYGVFIARLTFYSLPLAPLTASSRGPTGVRTTIPGAPSSDPMFALPLFFLRMGERSTRDQVRMRDVTLELPRQEWVMMYIAAIRGAAAMSAWPLIAGFTDFRLGAFGASQAGIHFSNLVGWGFNATNLYLIPESVIDQAELDQLVATVDERSGALPATGSTREAGASAGDGDANPSTKVLVGAIVGGVLGGIVLLAAAFFVVREFKLRRLRLRYSLSLSGHKRTGGLDSQGSGSGGIGKHVVSSKDGQQNSFKSGPLRDTSNYSSNTNVVSQTSSSMFASQAQWSSVYSVPALSPHNTYGPIYSEYDPQGGPTAPGTSGTLAGDSIPEHSSGQRTNNPTPASPCTPAENSGTGPALKTDQLPLVALAASRANVGGSRDSELEEGPLSLGFNAATTVDSSVLMTQNTVEGGSQQGGSQQGGSQQGGSERGGSQQGGSQQGGSQQGGSQQGGGSSALAIALPSSSVHAAVSPKWQGWSGATTTQQDPTARGQFTPPVSFLKKGPSSAALNSKDSRPASLALTFKPVGSRGLDGDSRRDSVARQNSGAPSNDSSLSKWDPKKEVAAMAQGMQADGDVLQLIEPIGRGGFGVVYRGKWRGLEVAVKTVLFSETGQGGAQQRAITEAAVCTSVLHPNVVATYHYDIMPVGQQGTSQRGLVVEDMTREGQAAGSMDWKLFLVQEYCHASLLNVLAAKLMHPDGKPDLDLLLTNLLDIAHGMAYLHSKNVLHGDLKPENVLLKNEATAAIGVVSKITDFGLATCLDPQRSHISNITNGTPYYAAPEVVTKGIINKASDVYSFGVLMWEMYLVESPWVKTDEGYQPNVRFPRFPDATPAPYAWLALKCLDEQNRTRPDFNTIISYLAAMHDAYLDGYDTLIKPARIVQLPMPPNVTLPPGQELAPVLVGVEGQPGLGQMEVVVAQVPPGTWQGGAAGDQLQALHIAAQRMQNLGNDPAERQAALRAATAVSSDGGAAAGTECSVQCSAPLASRRDVALRSQAFTSMLSQAQVVAQKSAPLKHTSTTHSLLGSRSATGGLLCSPWMAVTANS